jgi:hypothetical protein
MSDKQKPDKVDYGTWSDSNSQPVSSGMKRREFLKVGGILAAGLALLKLGVGLRNSEGSDSSTTVTPTSTPENRSEIQPDEIMFTYNGIQVWGERVENTRIPTRWQDSQGNSGTFDREALLALNQQAITNNETRFLTPQRVQQERSSPTLNQSERPLITDLPEDIVSHEELSARGIEVIASPKRSLTFRQSMFEQGGILDFHQQANDQRLKIVLVDNPTLSRYAFEDTRYDSVREIIDDIFLEENLLSPEQIRQHYRESFEAHMRSSSFGRDEIAAKAEAIVTLTDQEIIDWGIYPHSVGGLHQQQGHRESLTDTCAIFMPMGDRPRNVDFLVVKTQPQENQFSVSVVTIDTSVDLGLSPSKALSSNQSYPEPAQFELTDSESTLLAGVNPETTTPGFVLRHELFHHRRHYLESTNAEVEGSVDSESQTDIDARNSIEEAFTHQQATGSDSKYAVILSSIDNGYHVIT